MKKRKLNSKNPKYHKEEKIKVRRVILKEIDGVIISKITYL